MLFENPSLNLKLKDRNEEQNTKIYKKLIEEEHKRTLPKIYAKRKMPLWNKM